MESKSINPLIITEDEKKRWEKLSYEDLKDYWDHYLTIIPGLEALLWDLPKRRHDSLTSIEADQHIILYEAMKDLKLFYESRCEFIETIIFSKKVGIDNLTK